MYLYLPYNKLSHWFWWSDSTYSLAWLGTDLMPSSKPKPNGLFKAVALALTDPDGPMCDDKDLLTRTCWGEDITADILRVKFRWGDEAEAMFVHDLAGLGTTPHVLGRPTLFATPDELVDDDMLLLRFWCIDIALLPPTKTVGDPHIDCTLLIEALDPRLDILCLCTNSFAGKSLLFEDYKKLIHVFVICTSLQ